MAEERFAFIVEWYDASAALIRRYELLFYNRDNSVEMIDIKNRKIFLRRTKIDALNLKDLYIGSNVMVFGRQLSIVDYSDEFTRRLFSSQKEKTFAMIKPDGLPYIGQILTLISESGLMVTKMKMTQFSTEDIYKFYNAQVQQPHFKDVMQHSLSGAVVGMEIVGEQAVDRWRRVLGPTDPAVARSEAPNSIRARFAIDTIRNVAHGSDSSETAKRELDSFFLSGMQQRRNTAVFRDCTCAIIKPHAVKAGIAGRILDKIIEANFEISALEMYTLQKGHAEEFFEVYKGVVHEYTEVVTEMISGPCIAMEIRAKDAPRTFREFCGPADPELARQLRPRTIRAIFGKNKVQNAIHCTDLPDDGLLEVEYFFKILNNCL